ncbi:MAG: hypothetical protein ACRD1O_11125 [Terriglobia bacterium]
MFFEYSKALFSGWLNSMGTILTISAIVLYVASQIRHKDVHISGWLPTLIGAIAFAFVSYRAWVKERREKQTVETKLLSPTEREVFKECRSRSQSYIELMRRFPNSAAVNNPFSTTWRPYVGNTTVPIDIQEMIAWHKDCMNFLNILESSGAVKATRLRSLALVSSASGGQLFVNPIACLNGFSEIENLILEKVIC